MYNLNVDDLELVSGGYYAGPLFDWGPSWGFNPSSDFKLTNGNDYSSYGMSTTSSSGGSMCTINSSFANADFVTTSIIDGVKAVGYFCENGTYLGSTYTDLSNNSLGVYICGGFGVGAGIGACLATNPLDLGVNVSAGSPGPALSFGTSNDTHSIISGFGASITVPVAPLAGVGVATPLLDPNSKAIGYQVGLPGGAISAGYTLRDTYGAAVQFITPYIDSFIQRNYPHPQESINNQY